MNNNPPSCESGKFKVFGRRYSKSIRALKFWQNKIFFEMAEKPVLCKLKDERPSTSAGSLSQGLAIEDAVDLSRALDQYTIWSGDRSKLKDLLCNRLTECGWRDEVRMMCRNLIREKPTVNSEELLEEITPRARQAVPDVVKRELLMKIKTILTSYEHMDVE